MKMSGLRLALGALCVSVFGAGLLPGTTAAAATAATSTHAVASVTPSSIDFGRVATRTTSEPRVVTVTNLGFAPLHLTGLSIDQAPFDPQPFAMFFDECSTKYLGWNESCTIHVSFFAPAQAGTFASTLRIGFNTGETKVVSLMGTAVAGSVIPYASGFGLDPVPLDGAPRVQDVHVLNTGPAARIVNGVSMSSPAEFSANASDCTTRVVATNLTCVIRVYFHPKREDRRTATMTVDAASGADPVVWLYGFGVGTADFNIQGPGSSFTDGHGNTVSKAIGTSASAKASFLVRIHNRSSSVRSYRVAAVASGASATASFTLSGNQIDLPKDGAGRWVLPDIAPGAYKQFALRVDPIARTQLITKHVLHLFTTSGSEHDTARFETNIAAPARGTDSFGLFAKGGWQPFIGGAFDGQATTLPALNSCERSSSCTGTFTIRLRNDGSTARSMTVRVSRPSGQPCWHAIVKDGSTDITSQAFGGGYTSRVLSPGSYQTLTLTAYLYVRGCRSAMWTVSTWDGNVMKHHSRLLAVARAGQEE